MVPSEVREAYHTLNELRDYEEAVRTIGDKEDDTIRLVINNFGQKTLNGVPADGIKEVLKAHICKLEKQLLKLGVKL